MGIWIINGVLLIAVLAILVYPMVRPRLVAKLLDNAAFNKHIAENGQLIDVRESADFRRKHIMGARNLPHTQIEQSLGAISKSKPVLLYENGRPQLTTKVAAKLKKNGYKDIFILKEGLSKWGGKIKES